MDDRIPGSALRVTVDKSHPLAAGVPEWLGVVKRGRSILSVQDNGYVVARYDDDPHLGGVLSDRHAERIGGTPAVTHHRVGSGVVICFSDDVTFRGFQHGATRLLLNAICYGPSLAD